MTLHIVRLGSARGAEEGLRIGTVRRPPRGVPKAEHASRDFYDVWFPNLAPSAELIKDTNPDDAQSWKLFTRRFRQEMKVPSARRDLELLAALSHHTNLAIGCYCADEARCHRSVLRELLTAAGADIAADTSP